MDRCCTKCRYWFTPIADEDLCGRCGEIEKVNKDWEEWVKSLQLENEEITKNRVEFGKTEYEPEKNINQQY